MFADLFLRYGAGASRVQRIATVKHWNLVAWILILLGSAGWAIFLLWNPQ